MMIQDSNIDFFIKTIQVSEHDSYSNNIENINACDPRALRANLLRIKVLPLSLRRRKQSNKENGILTKTVFNSFNCGFAIHALRNEKIPYLDEDMLKIILHKIHFLIDHLHSNSNLLSPRIGTSKMISFEQLCRALCDCAFMAINWKATEAIPIIRNILHSQSMGNTSLYKTHELIKYISSRNIRDQALFGKIESWLKFTRSIIVSKVRLKYCCLIDSKAHQRVDFRNSEVDAILSGVFKFLMLNNRQDKIFLKDEATIFEYASVENLRGNLDIYPCYLMTTFKLVLDNLKNSFTDLSLARGLLSLVFIRTDPEKLEEILQSSAYINQTHSKKKSGIKIKNNILRAYRNGAAELFSSALDGEERKNYKVCKSIEFYYSMNRSNKKTLGCDEGISSLEF